MKSSDRSILIGIAVVGVLAAFWFLVLSPKREEAASLGAEIEKLQASVSAEEQLAAFGEQAKGDYESNYHRLVVLGKAVPGDDDSASLLEQAQAIADRAGVNFRSILLSEGEVAAPPPAAAETTADAPAGETPESAPAATGTAAPATEASAATVPIGSTVGPAGLPVMPYDVSLRGTFFELADYLAELDSMVRTKAKGVGVDGRLLTVDGFVFSGDMAKGFPYLDADLHLTSFVAPADQGLTGGATLTSPAPTVPSAGTVTPTAATTPTP